MSGMCGPSSEMHGSSILQSGFVYHGRRLPLLWVCRGAAVQKAFQATDGGAAGDAAGAGTAAGDLAVAGSGFAAGSVDHLAASPADPVETKAEAIAQALGDGASAVLADAAGRRGWWQPPLIALGIMLAFLCVFQRRPVWRRLRGSGRSLPRRRATVGA